MGFRYHACRAADVCGCSGWVHNERDGTVSMEIQGSEEMIDQAVSMIAQGTYVRIDATECQEIPVVGDASGFFVF